jgi:anti-sigma factor RsiW
MHDLLHGYADGELDLVHTLQVEQHLQGCPDCARACDALRALRRTLRSSLPRHAPPPGLAGRVGAAVRQAARGRPRALSRLPYLAAAAALAVVALGLWALAQRALAPSGHERLVEEVVASHVRSQLLAGHLLDVTSSDRHTVKPWFHGKLDFAPPVRDLKPDGFELAGGRLDYVNGRLAAALVYRRRQHVINLLLWPASEEGESEVQGETKQGYHLLHWRRGGMEHWAVSDLNPRELADFAGRLRGE